MKRIIAAIMLAVLLLSLTACGTSKANAQIEAWCAQYCDGLISGDMDKSYAVVQNLITEEDFAPIFDHYHSLMAGVESYELKQLGINFNLTGGVNTYMATFLVTSEQGNFIIEITDADDTELPDNLIFGTQEEIEPYLKPY